MGNHQSGVQAPAGRRPNDREMMVLLQLQKKLFARLVESPQHLALLERYWRASCGSNSNGNAPAFARSSPLWRERGGFSGDSPAGDLRCTGELGLRCLVVFAETYPAEASMMKRRRGGYPFAKAATALVRALSEIFHLVDESGRVSDFPVTRTFFWQVLTSEQSFYRLFALLFLRFDELYCDEVARHRALLDADVCPIAVVVRLVDKTKRGLLTALSQAPASLDELRGLCGNGAAVLDPSKAIEVDDPSPLGTTATSRWKERGTPRRSMRELGRNWGKTAHSEPRIGVVESGVSLTPRSPEIVLGPVEAGDSEAPAESGGDDQEGDTSSSLTCSTSSEAPDASNNEADPMVSSMDGSDVAKKDLFEGLVVSQSSISPASSFVSIDGVDQRWAAPMS
jgi:hypothetical protein